VRLRENFRMATLSNQVAKAVFRRKQDSVSV
jgi:hypothetical protein